MIDKLNCAVIGTRFAARTILPAISKIGHVNIKYLIGGENKAKTKEIAESYHINNYELSFEEILIDEGLDAVFIATPHDLHYSMLKKAIEKNLIIFIEKPLANNIEEIDEIISLSKRNDQVMLVTHQLPYYPVFTNMKEKLDLLGEVYYINIQYQTNRLTNINQWNWCLDSERGGGMLLAMGSHIISLLHYFFGRDFNYSHLHSYMDNNVEKVKAMVDTEVYKTSDAESTFEFQFMLNESIRANVLCVGTGYDEDSLRIKIMGSSGEMNFSSNEIAKIIYKDLDNKLVDELLDSNVDKGKSIWKVGYDHFINEVLSKINLKGELYADERNTPFEVYKQQFLFLETVRKQKNQTFPI